MRIFRCVFIRDPSFKKRKKCSEEGNSNKKIEPRACVDLQLRCQRRESKERKEEEKENQ